MPLSALQHVVFCERRAMLIHLEGQWSDSVATVEGGQLHEHVDQEGHAAPAGIPVAYRLPLCSPQLGVQGFADAVEFHPVASGGILLPHRAGRHLPFPVEYKRGKRRHEHAYEVQLCAQAMCLEHMLGVEVPRGALFYARSRRRLEVVFTRALRDDVVAAVARLRELWAQACTPPAQPGPKCRECSLQSVCLPQVTAARTNVAAYIARQLRADRETS